MMSIVFPILLLALASLGMGGIILIVFRQSLPLLPFWLQASFAYFLGQGVLAATFLLLALAKMFTPGAILTLLIPGALVGLYFLWVTGSRWREYIGDNIGNWAKVPLGWKILSILSALFFASGFTTLGGWLEGDSIAFYFAVSKVTAFTHQLSILPGYESFMNVGLLAEMLIASLMSLGMPNISPRIFSWVNQMPTLALFYGLARHCGLGWRGGLLAAMVPLTSSAVILLWGNTKTDLYAVGPSVACCLIALTSWDRRFRVGCILLSGVLCGFAVQFKLSYLLPLMPTVILLINWNNLFAAARALRDKVWGEIGRLFRIGLKENLLFTVGFACAFLPHVLKNLYLLNAILGSNPLNASWYAPETVTRLLLSYPFALTYGRYWAQLGDLSPLVLAFIPLLICLPRPLAWSESKLGALAVASFVGLCLWMILMPSIFMPRYFLGTLLILGIPAAAGAECFSRRSAMASITVFLAAAITLTVTPAHVTSWSKAFNLSNTLSYLKDPENELIVSSPLESYCMAHKAINYRAVPNDRILMLTYYRFWLRPDLIQRASSQQELVYIWKLGGYSWDRFKDLGFRFILVDSNLFPAAKDFIASKPDDIHLNKLYEGGALIAVGALTAYEVSKVP